MSNYNSEISGWLKDNSGNLLHYLPSGSGICRVVSVEPQAYWTGYVSSRQGSFKLPDKKANWYGTSFGTSFAEMQPASPPIYEYWQLNQDAPVWDMSRLPESFLHAIYDDRDLATGKYLKSQFVIECLESLGVAHNASGIFFPSRRAEGGVLVANPHAVKMKIVYTGMQLPSP